MKTNPVSTILGFYSEPSTAESSYRELRAAGLGKVSLFGPGDNGARGSSRRSVRYAGLRLDGESLVVVETNSSNVGAVVPGLRRVGSPAVFTTQEFKSIQAEREVSREPLTGDRLGDYMIDLARRHGQPGKSSPAEPLLTRLLHGEAAIDESCSHLIEAVRLGHGVTAAAEWLLDNYYLVRVHAAEIRRHLPRHYARILPQLPTRGGSLRIAEVARELVLQTDRSLSEASIVDSVRAYQTVEPLAIAELWAYPLLLKLALVEGLAGLAARVSEAQQLREAAYLWANRLAASARQGSEPFQKIMNLLESEHVIERPHFVTCLAEQLQGDENTFVLVQRWIEQHLQSHLTQLVASEHIREASERVSISNTFRSLRTLSQIDFTAVFEAVSLVEARLREEPSGIYANSNFSTRDECRRGVEETSRSTGLSELAVAAAAVRMASANPDNPNVTWYLLGEGIGQLESELHARPSLRRRFIRGVRRHATPVYLGSIGILTACFLLIAVALAWAGGGRTWRVAGFAILAVFILSELAVQVVNALVVSLLPPERLPKMDFKEGIPADSATLVVIPMMLSNPQTVRRELEKLEMRFLANPEEYLFFSLLSDFTDCDELSTSTDNELLALAQRGIDELNQRYSGERFLLFHRDRVWCESEQKWIGWERKRGKLEELNAFLCGEGRADLLSRGRLPIPIRYVITLDADTQLPPGTALRMVATIAHPLNRVEIDPVTRTRRRGFTVIQPRVGITLPSATASLFTKVFADARGTDPYCEAVSDAHQDLFGEAMFHGKAIYDVHAFHTILGGRFPPETLLSHDLIEGAHVGVALASDIELLETVPDTYAGYSQRQRRWIRGDWQVAPWVLARVPSADGGRVPNPLSLIDRWRIGDNLRRSLVPIASLLLLLIAWLTSATPGVWTLVVALAVAIPAFVPVLDRLAHRVQGSVRVWRGAPDELARALVSLALLPHQAWLAADAIGRVTYRRWVSRRNLLEWQTAEMAQDSHGQINSTLRQLLLVAGLSAIALIAVLMSGMHLTISFFATCWVLAPALIIWLDRPLAGRSRRRITGDEDIIFLRGLARRTWRYFDDLVGEASHWLPPDNTQLALRVEVAQRTSPTNIGFWLVSALAAFDLGYLTVEEFVRRCLLTMSTLDGMERYEGHLLNWYDTRTLEPLLPRYVSTVDSGNLLASLWVLEQGCHDALASPLLGPSCILGLADTLGSLTEASENDSSAAAPLRELRRLLRGDVQGHELIGRLRLAMVPVRQLADKRDWADSPSDERSYWAGCLAREVQAWIAIVDGYLSWMEVLIQPPDSILRALGEGAVKLRWRAVVTSPSLNDLANDAVAPVNALLGMRRVPGMPQQLVAWLDQVATEYGRAKASAVQTVEKLRSLTAKAAAWAGGIKMAFLYNPKTHLFAIGYAVGGPVDFSSHYDLLASECRLASLVAIAKGEIPIEHWFTLGRPRATSPVGDILLSWNGAMFEYLMPLLFTNTFANSLLDDACRQAVKLQIRYGRERGVPWGVSESAYSALDSNQIYQYRAFGVPGLGLKPGLEDDLVVAPYATMLALMVDAPAAVSNLRRLDGMKLGGPLGLYESIDFSRESSPEGERGVVVYNDMAHHQGMSLLALDNALLGDVMRRRFHSDLRVRAVESLLFERIPLVRPPLDEIRTSPQLLQETVKEEPAEQTWNSETSIPRVHLQGNSRYSVMLTNSGGGYSRYGDFDLTRWRSDTTLDAWGSFIYIREMRSGRVWSTTYQPTAGKFGTVSARFAPDRAEFQRRAFGIDAATDVTVAPEDDAELRRVTVTNRLLRSRDIELTSFAELALAPHNADRAHPAFAKMFVETECLDGRILIAHRRQRSPEDPQLWAAHLIVGASGPIQFETDRREFLGRGNSAESPDAVKRDLTGSLGTVLDPVFSLRCRVHLDSRGRHEVTFVTLAASSRDALLTLIAKYGRGESATRAFEMAWTRAQLEFRYLGIGPSAAQRFQELASHLLYPNPSLRPPGDRISRNRLGQTSLWAYGVSGDLPIVTVAVAESRDLPLVRELLLAHTYWRMRGFRADVVVMNQEVPHYQEPLRQQLERLIRAHSLHTGTDRPGGVFLKEWHAMPEEDRTLFLAASGAVLYGGRGSLQQQLVTGPDPSQPPAFAPAGNALEEPSQPLPFLELPYFNGMGGFTQDGREYAIYLTPGSHTPAPWANVMAHASFGTLVSESGLGFTWSGNSQANRLTPWHNDPVGDPQSEIIYLRDEDSGAVWTPTALPVREDDAYRARHGQGYTVYEHNSHSIGQELTVFVPCGVDWSEPVKIYRLRLRNHSSHSRRLSATYFAEWVMGTDREEQQLHVETSWDDESGALLARNVWNTRYSGSVAFAAATPRALSHSGDRGQFLGRNGSCSHPAALKRTRLDNRTGGGLDPGAALQVAVTIEPATQVEVTFLLGQVTDVEQVRALVSRYSASEQVDGSLAQTRQAWDERLGVVTVTTPILSVDFLLNRWLLYQTLSCRFWGRSGFYQSGGAFGFRDQLQDSMALVYSMPSLARRHVLTAAAHQFAEGDVLHWWHDDTGTGVRTRCADDLVWLPYVAAHYVEVTGDTGVLDESVAFIEGPLLQDGEQEKLFTPVISGQTASLWEHCRRALDHAWRLGSHGVPLFGSGDWNDGMNRVGAGGRGESVWLAWFLHATCKAFAVLCEGRDAAIAERMRERAESLASATEHACWDGEWYLRGFFDNGSPLGSRANPEAQIDSLPQSWAVISGAADTDRAERALKSANRRLVRPSDRLVLLFDPPFNHSEPSPGYIMGYPPGVRENGGQYTHGSLWLAMAHARLRDVDAAVALLQLMNPVECSRHPEEAARYQTEPYVMAADICSAPGKLGHGGWTWYTGSAAWMYRIWLEEVLGLRVRGETLAIDPAIPGDWSGYQITYRHGSTVYRITVERDARGAAPTVGDNGHARPIRSLRLADDGGSHDVVVRIPASRSTAVPLPRPV